MSIHLIFMSNPEQLNSDSSIAKDNHNANEGTSPAARLYEGAYIQRVSDPNPPFIRIQAENPNPQQPATPQVRPGDANAPAVKLPETAPAAGRPSGLATDLSGGGSWRNPNKHRTTDWPGPSPATWPGPNGTQWNGNRADRSRGPGGVLYQPRPGFQNTAPEQPITTPAQPPQVTPGLFPPGYQGPVDATGRPTGPNVLPGSELYPRPAEKPAVPADPGTPGGLIDRNGDGKLEDERSEKDKELATLNLVGFIAGIAVGASRGRLKGAIVGGVLGYISGELVKPLFKG